MSRQWDIEHELDNPSNAGSYSTGGTGLCVYVNVRDVHTLALSWPTAVRAMAKRLREIADDLDAKAKEEETR